MVPRLLRLARRPLAPGGAAGHAKKTDLDWGRIDEEAAGACLRRCEWRRRDGSVAESITDRDEDEEEEEEMETEMNIFRVITTFQNPCRSGHPRHSPDPPSLWP